VALKAIVCGIIRSAQFNGVNSALADGRIVATCCIFPTTDWIFLRGHPVLFQEPGGGIGNTERFALREMLREHLAIIHKT
jgi:hypothetical protein